MKRENEIKKFNSCARLHFEQAKALDSINLENFSTASTKLLHDALFYKLNALCLQHYDSTLQENIPALQDLLKDSYICRLTKRIKGESDMEAMQELLNL